METTQDRQKWLDDNQYTTEGIHRYEKIFGEDFLSTGGKEMTEKVVSLLCIRPGMKILDVGCGIGGSCFYIASHFNAHVDGIDLSENMLRIANEKLERKYPRLKEKVTFKLADCLTMEADESSYDVIYSRDAILHVGDKEGLFRLFHKWLKPGGRLLITDYCAGDRKDHSEEFLAYVKSRNYHLITVTEYGHILEKIFPEVWSDDRTATFIKTLRKEIAHLQAHKEAVLKDMTEEDFNYLIQGWEAKVQRASNNDQAWGLFLATKEL